MFFFGCLRNSCVQIYASSLLDPWLNCFLLMWNWVIFCTCTPTHQDNKMIFNIWMIFFLRIKLIIMLHAYKTWKIFLKILIKFWNFYPGCYGHSRRGGTTTRRPPARRPCSRGTGHGALTLTCFIIILWHLTSKNSTLWK